MEKYTIVFVETDVPPAESDYYYKEKNLKRAFTFPEIGLREKNYGSFKKAVPYLCSKSIALNDNTLYSENDYGPVLEAVVIAMDFEKKMATLLLCDSTSKVVSFNECYYPLAEVINNLEPVKDRQLVDEKEFILMSFCPACNQQIKRIGNCQTQTESCERNNSKTYALIENKP